MIRATSTVTRGRPQDRRASAIEYSATEAATPALSDSSWLAIGIETSWSQVSDDQARQAVALGADDEHQRTVGEVEVGQAHVAVGGQTDRPCSRRPGRP